MENVIQRPSGISASERCIISSLDFFSGSSNWVGVGVGVSSNVISSHLISSHLDPFQDRAVDDIYESIYSATASHGDTPTSVEFLIPGSGDFLIPTSCRIDITIEIRNGDNSRLKKPTAEAPNYVGFLNG